MFLNKSNRVIISVDVTSDDRQFTLDYDPDQLKDVISYMENEHSNKKLEGPCPYKFALSTLYVLLSMAESLEENEDE